MSDTHDQSPRRFQPGWLLVLALAVLTLPLLNFIATNTPAGAVARQTIMLGDAAIAMRAIVGFFQRDASRAWRVYAALCPGVILITAFLSALIVK